MLCPIDFRYGRPKMKAVFEEDARLQRLLDVEAALARAEAKAGPLPGQGPPERTAQATTQEGAVPARTREWQGTRPGTTA